MLTFQEIITRLNTFWAEKGCLLLFPYDLEKGAGTSNPSTFLRALGPEPFSAAYVEPCRRPKDGRYGLNPNRLQYYFQYQVMLKPSPDNIVDLYLQSLESLGLNLKEHDIRFVHDDWENPTLGASGLGWEVWIDGMEMTQFTYFQNVAGLALTSVPGEITYGIERIAMCLQGVDSIFDIQWNDSITYGDLFKLQEEKWSRYNFELQDDSMWKRHFEDFKCEALKLLDAHDPIPAYDFVLKSSHAFNMLDAKGVISVSERASYIAAIRELSKRIGEEYVALRKSLEFPLSKKKTSKKQITSQSPSFLNPTTQNETERFVLEIGSEELPATFVPIGIQQLETKAKALLTKEKIPYKSLHAFGTPRRLTLILEEVQTSLAESSEEKKGPSIDRVWDTNGNLTAIGEGFFKSLGRDTTYSIDQIRNNQAPSLSIRSIKGADYLFVRNKSEKQSTLLLLQKLLPTLIASLEFPKMMHWGDHELLFARPIRWILSLFGTEQIDFSVGPIRSSSQSKGHRILSPNFFTLHSASEYEEELEKRNVIVDQAKRQILIEEQLKNIEKEQNASALGIAKVQKEVLYLVEYPFLQALPFEKELLNAPKEVIISEMVEHQKYFPLLDTHSNTLLPLFVITANIPVNDNVIKGNQKVLSARLNDGRFLWEEDCKIGIHTLKEKLSSITYQRSLGSIEEKCTRIAALASTLCPLLHANSQNVEIGSTLSKADLASNVVGEFPELQGIVGALLAKKANLSSSISAAINDHWLPNLEGGPIPSTAEGSCISLADKIDTLMAFFALSLQPSSSHDPYALRRQALGIVRILIEGKHSLSLLPILEEAKRSIQLLLQKDLSSELISDLLRFINQRAKVYSTERYPKELVEAVFASPVDNLYQAESKLAALTLLNSSKEGASFVEVLKRTLGQIEGHPKAVPNPSLFVDISEKTLLHAIECALNGKAKAFEKNEFTPYLQLIISLQHPINDFFNKVHVLDEDPKIRSNRIALLWQIFDLVQTIADPKSLVCMKH